MQSFDELPLRNAMRRSNLAMATLLVAGFFVPAPGNLAVVAIAATGLVLIGAQRLAARRLAA